MRIVACHKKLAKVPGSHGPGGASTRGGFAVSCMKVGFGLMVAAGQID